MNVTEFVYFSTRKGWRGWLARHHAGKREVWLVRYKRSSGKSRVSYNDAVEEALCFGWIDSTVKTLDAARYAQRFTPRKPGSNWSRPNLDRVARLTIAGLMKPAGVARVPTARAAAAFRRKHELRTTGTTRAPRDLAAALRANPRAAASWRVLAPGYRRTHIRWIGDAKQAETRARRIVRSVDRLARGLKPVM